MVSGLANINAPIAQRTEHLATDQGVGGSNPSGCANYKMYL